MPNCFVLIPKGEKEPARFSEIDDQMRKFFKMPPNKTHWLWSWYDVIGLALAFGKTWKQVREITKGLPVDQAVDYLEERYDAQAWYEHK